MKNKRNFNPDMLIVYKAIEKYCSAEDLQQIADMCSLGALKTNLKEALNPSGENPTCPQNASHRVVKNGRANGKQRYLCKDCRHTFVEGGQSMLGYSKIDLLKWKKVIISMLDRHLPLEQLSELCEISQTTAFYMRLRIFYVAELLNQDIKLSGEIVADDTRFSFSAKGQDVNEIHRKARKRGGQNTIKNHYKNEINVMVAVERIREESNKYKIVSVVTGFGTPNFERVTSALKNKIKPDNNTVLITDGAPYFRRLVKELNIRWVRLASNQKGHKKVPTIDGEHNIQLVNHFHSRLKERFSSSSSVSSKYLKGYLQVFDFTVNYSHLSSEEQANLILKTLLASDIRLTTSDLANRYCLPQYKDQVAGEWKKHFSKKEIKLYGEIKRGAIKKDLIKKYGTSYKRMRTLVKKIDSMKIEDEVMLASLAPDNMCPISNHSWEIYTLYNTGRYTQKELAQKFFCTKQNIGKIVRRINNRPEGYERHKPTTKAELQLRRKKERFLKKKQKTQECYQEIYDAFNVLCSGRSEVTLTKAYEILGKRFRRSIYNIRNIVFAMRKKDRNAVWRKKGKRVAVDVKHEFKKPEAG